MTPTSAEKQAALAWADRREEDVAIVVQPESFWRHVFVLASALRQAEADLELMGQAAANSEKVAQELESRLKTLEEENARMREAVETQRVFLQRLDDLGGLGLMVHDAIRAEIDNIDAALKQEAE